MFTSLLSTFVATMFAIQAASTPAPSTATPTDTKTTVRLKGCVSRDITAPGSFTFAETGSGVKYRLGALVRKYAGQRVEIVGAPVGRRPAISGGLYPSPNAAAQAGAMDPTQAAIASQSGGPSSGTGSFELPEFRVTRVRPLGGACQ
jgi:hypothetical protein